MASSLIPLLLLSSTLGEQPGAPFLDPNFNNYGLRLPSSDFYYPSRDLYFPSLGFPERHPLESYWPWKGFHMPNYLTKEGLQIVLNVAAFKPEEVEVRVITRELVISAKHEDEAVEGEKGHGNVYRQFERRYVIPKNVDLDKVTSTISSDGILTVRAPFKTEPEASEGKKIPIEKTGQPALKPNKNTDKKDEGHKVEVATENKKEPESREEDKKTEETNDVEGDIDGVTVTSATEESTTPLK